MRESKLKVRILAHTPNPDKVIAMAGKLCYSPVGVDELENKLDKESVDKFVNMLASLGHESPLEHCSFTFAVEGVSRVLLAQLTRHRLASFSVQSQRYVNLTDNFEFIVPQEIEKDSLLKERYLDAIRESVIAYNELTEILRNSYIEQGMKPNMADKKAIENARYVLPNSCETKIVFTMNVRSLYNFLALRECSRAQDEIQELASEMLKQLKEIAPILFKKAGAGCRRGRCPEGKMTCGVPKL